MGEHVHVTYSCVTADTKRGAVVMLPETRPVLCQAAVQELQLAPAIFTFATCSHTRTNDTWLLEAGDNASVSSGFEGDSGSVGRTPCRPSSQLRRQLSAAFSASAREVNHTYADERTKAGNFESSACDLGSDGTRINTAYHMFFDKTAGLVTY